MVRIEFETTNAAFDDDPPSEVARILRDLADRWERVDPVPFAVIDRNGNVIGTATDDSGEV